MKELQKDIFEWIEENKKDNVIFLCHCISSDWALGAGFAKEVQKRFQEREFLAHTPGFRSDWQGRGFSLITTHPTLQEVECNFYICNLVTKEKYWQKPTYTTLEQALNSAKKTILAIQNIRGKKVKIVMPKIGCGLDKLSWGNVKEMIVQWAGFDLDVTVCFL